jgi:exosortase/archaeosortase family protein
MPRDLVPVAALGLGLMACVALGNTPSWTLGWLIPASSIAVLLERRARIVEAWLACGAPASPRANDWRGSAVNAAVACVFAFGVAAFLAGSFYRVGAGPSLKAMFAVSMGVPAMLISLPWLAAPLSPPPTPARTRDDARWRLCSLLVFPAGVWLLSGSQATLIEGQLSLYLLDPLIALVSFVFNMSGFPLGHEGNILVMPDHGLVGIEEACSGIRSLTASLFAGCFLGAVFLGPLWKKVVLVAAAGTLALGMNFLRSLFLTGWAYGHGTRAVEGPVHDAAGYAVLALTVTGLFGLVALLNRPARGSLPRAATGRTPATGRS